MAGLLDAFNDPGFQRGLMMFAASMPQSEQSRAGLLAYMDNQEEAKLKRGLLGLQMDRQQMEMDAMRSAADRQAQGQQFLSGLMSRGQPSQQDQARVGMESSPGFAGPVSPQAMQAVSQPNLPWTSQLTLDDVAAAKTRYGQDLMPIYNAAQQGVTFKPGEVTRLPSGQVVSIAKDGMINSLDGSVRAAPGAAIANAEYQGRQTDAIEGAKYPFARALERDRAGIAASHDLVQVFNPNTGRPEYGTRAQAISAANNRPPPVIGNFGARQASLLPGGGGNIQSPGYAGGDRARANADSISIMKNELMKPDLTAEDRQAIQREIARLEQQTPGASATGPLAAGPSAAEQARNDANATFQRGLATSASDMVTSSQAGAQSAAGTLQNVEQIRSGLQRALIGPGTSPVLMWDRVAQTLGVGGANSAERLSATRNVIQGLARQELAASSAMKGQGTLTDSERAILRRAEAGEIDSMSKPELETLLGSLEKTANHRIQSHEQLMSRVESGASPTTLLRNQSPAAPAPAQVPPVSRLKTAPSDADIRNTALKYGIPVEEVRQRLGM